MVIIVEPVRRVYFESPYLDGQRLTVVAGQPVDVRCVAVGGNPPPMLDVYIDWLNITRLFDLRRSFELRRQTGSVDSGEDRNEDAEETTRGLRVMGVTTVLETRRFVARVRDHGLETRITALRHMSRVRDHSLEIRHGMAQVRDHGLTLHCRSSSSSSDVHSVVSNVTLFVNCQ